MKTGYIQFCPELLKVENNLKKVNDLFSGIDADIMVLPEFFNSGYCFKDINEVRAVAENIPNGITTDFLIETARKKNLYISAGISEDDNGVFYNSSVLVGPNGYIGKYRKVHLFYNEKLFFKRGNLGYPIFDIENVRIGMLICFDWIFPEAMRTLALAGSQVILHMTNLVMPYYQMASKVRALENRVFIVLSNRYGEEKNGEFSYSFTGRSQIVDPTGEVLICSPENSDDIKIVDIDPNIAKNKDLNPLNNLWEDI